LLGGRPQREHVEAREARPARAEVPLAKGDLESALPVDQRDPAHVAVLDVLGDQFEVEQVPVPGGAPPEVADRQLDVLDPAHPDAHVRSFRPVFRYVRDGTARPFPEKPRAELVDACPGPEKPLRMG
jgi:hypothetical protein